jgi:hypothetical protein
MPMRGQPCQICKNPEYLRIAAEMIAAGATDRAVANKIGGINRMTIFRHRHNHIEKPLKALVAAANKGRAVQDEREQLVAAAEGGDVAAAFLGLEKIAADMRAVYARLERVAGAAEADNQRLAVASLSTAQLRGAEVRARLGGVGHYAAPKADRGAGVPFVLHINFSGRPTTTIEGTTWRPDDPMHDAPTPTFASIDTPDRAPERHGSTLGGDEDDEDLADDGV